MGVEPKAPHFEKMKPYMEQASGADIVTDDLFSSVTWFEAEYELPYHTKIKYLQLYTENVDFYTWCKGD